jgi:hypothetical protein
MTVYVVVEMFQGVVNDVKVFPSEESANEVERARLAAHDITNDMDRKGKAHNGTELLMFECKAEV